MRTRILAAVVLVICSCAGLARGDELSLTGLDDPVERILLCTPQGPVIVQVSMKIDGQPYRHQSEKIVDEHFLLLGDNRSWEAAIANEHFLAGLLLKFRSPRARVAQAVRHDRDADGLISRDELRSLVLNDAEGDAVHLTQGTAEPHRNEQILALIDTNGDWRLSAEELATAAAHVANADFSRDGALTILELDRAVPRPRSRVGTVGVLLGRPGGATIAAREMCVHYAHREGGVTREAFQLAPALFD